MWLGKKIKINNNIGEVIDQSGDYIYVKFEFGKFVFNKTSIKSSQIIEDNKVCTN